MQKPSPKLSRRAMMKIKFLLVKQKHKVQIWWDVDATAKINPVAPRTTMLPGQKNKAFWKINVGHCSNYNN